MKHTIQLTDAEITKNNMINEKVSNDGMSTDEMIKLLKAVPFEQFQDELYEKIIGYKR